MRKIIFDVDNVLADTTNCWCRKASAYLGKDIPKETVRNEKIVGSVPMPRSEIYRIQDEIWLNWQYLPMTETGIPQLISEIREIGFRIVVATCRPSRSAPLVAKWLSSNGICYDSFHSLGPYSYKADLGCDILVDDSANQIRGMIEKGKTGFLYSQPWNESAKISGAIRINQLSELRHFLQKSIDTFFIS